MIKIETTMGTYRIGSDLKVSGPDALVARSIELLATDIVADYTPAFGQKPSYIAARLSEQRWVTSAVVEGVEQDQGDLVF